MQVGPSWPHLQLVYEFFLRFIVSSDVDPKVAKVPPALCPCIAAGGSVFLTGRCLAAKARSFGPSTG